MAAPTDAQLSAPAPRVGVCIYMDIDGLPMRFALAMVPVIAPATTILPVSDPEFDGQTFTTADPRILSVSPVRHGPGGAEALEVTASGTLGLDADLMTAFSNPARFWGRVVRLWLVVFDDNWQPVAARPHYTGYMSTPAFDLQPPDDQGNAQQVIRVRGENYLDLLGGDPPSRTLLWSPDPDDRAAAATTGAAGASAALGIIYGGTAEPRNTYYQEY